MAWMEPVAGDHARWIADHDQLDRASGTSSRINEPPWSFAFTLA